MELADGTHSNNVALKHGDSEVILTDVNGVPVKEHCSFLPIHKIYFL